MKKIFISYSHNDEEWKDRLVSQLKVVELEGFCNVWDDRRIGTGTDWLPQIETAINEADIAILMVSDGFLSSDFIRTKEVPRFLERRKNEGLWVIPLFLKACAWETVEWLKKIQGVPTDGISLEEHNRVEGKVNRLLANLVIGIAKKIQGDTASNASTITVEALAKEVSPRPSPQTPQSRAGNLENPFTETMAIRDGIRFIGRENELRRLKRMLSGGSVSLQGDHKIGKSSLLWQLAAAWPGKVIGPLSFQVRQWHEMVEVITFQAGRSYKSHDDFRDALLHLEGLLLLDEMELGPEKGLTHVDCGLIRGCLEENRGLKLLMTSQKPVMKDVHLVGRDSPLYNICLPFRLGPLNEEDARRLLAHPWETRVPMFSKEIEDELLASVVYSPQDDGGDNTSRPKGSAWYLPYLLQRAAFHRFEALSDPRYNWKTLLQEDKEQLL